MSLWLMVIGDDWVLSVGARETSGKCWFGDVRAKGVDEDIVVDNGRRVCKKKFLPRTIDGVVNLRDGGIRCGVCSRENYLNREWSSVADIPIDQILDKHQISRWQKCSDAGVACCVVVTDRVVLQEHLSA